MKVVKFTSETREHWVDPDAPPGRMLATEIRNRLQTNGGDCSEVDLHSEFGWAWIQKHEGAGFYLLMTQADGKADSWSLSVEPASLLSFLGFSKTPKRELEVCKSLQRVLQSIDEISIVGWFDNREELSHLRHSTGRPNP